MNNIPTIEELFDLAHSIAGGYLCKFKYPWEALADLKNFIIELGKTLPKDEYDSPKENVWIAKDAKVFESAYIGAPCIIDHGAEVRHCAFIRGSAIIGKNSVFGNSCEIKNSIIFDDAQTPHYNYVGDSILGWHSHMGAGSITSNVKSDRTDIVIKSGKETLETGRYKIGAMLGDFVEVGCNSVLNPGTVIGRHTNIYPLSRVRGVVRENSIYKDEHNIVLKEDRT
ncbi:MAG: UDP-N-acetylglucosamine pyrophosphorylase [Clostridia bacterium]|nr:UDP-N-acetylglucosamine pyrophosphorylase [Clostridia bacterium]